MNKTQKSAWFTLASFLMCAIIVMYAIVKLLVWKSFPGSSFGKYWSLIAYLVILMMSVFFLRKKQSPNEVNADERDDLIKKRAILASFVSLCLLLAVSSIIPQFILGEQGSIPVFLLPLINLAMFIISMTVYSIAILIQYGWGSKNGQE